MSFDPVDELTIPLDFLNRLKRIAKAL